MGLVKSGIRLPQRTEKWWKRLSLALIDSGWHLGGECRAAERGGMGHPSREGGHFPAPRFGREGGKFIGEAMDGGRSIVDGHPVVNHLQGI